MSYYTIVAMAVSFTIAAMWVNSFHLDEKDYENWKTMILEVKNVESYDDFMQFMMDSCITGMDEFYLFMALWYIGLKYYLSLPNVNPNRIPYYPYPPCNNRNLTVGVCCSLKDKWFMLYFRNPFTRQANGFALTFMWLFYSVYVLFLLNNPKAYLASHFIVSFSTLVSSMFRTYHVLPERLQDMYVVVF